MSMKNIWTKILTLFAFILCFCTSTFALSDFTVNSVIFDNSSSVLLLNSKDSEDYDFNFSAKKTLLPEENLLVYDFENFVLAAQTKNIQTTSPLINEISLAQISHNPNTVRLAIKYNKGFDPNAVKIKHLDSTIAILISPLHLQNFYFQHSYTDDISSVSKMFEPISIQIPVLAQQNIASQINSAFSQGNQVQKDYVFVKKDLLLSGKYYLDNVTVKNGVVTISGVGGVTLSKPLILSEPDRIVFDIPNAQLNSVFHNEQIQINQSDSIKIAQFNENTVRIVITSPECQKYFPVFSYDLQKFIITKKELISSSKRATLNSFQDEIVDKNTHSVKVVLSSPVVYSTERSENSFDLLLHNVDRLNDENFNSVFKGVKASKLSNGGYRIAFPVPKDSVINIHSGIDGKTLRIRIKSEEANLPIADIDTDISIANIIPVRPDGKKVIVIDPGHGGSDCGAIRNKINEKDITLEISKSVVNILEKKGYNVYVTRYGDETVSLQERVEISENIMPDVFVSIHVNSSNSSSPNGIETHYYKDNSLMLAKTVHASMLNHIKANDRGLFKSKFYVINHTTSPAILVEIGFLSNEAERAQIVTHSRKQSTAKAIAEGIDEFLKKQ